VPDTEVERDELGVSDSLEGKTTKSK
jgi:hypothetical protein